MSTPLYDKGVKLMEAVTEAIDNQTVAVLILTRYDANQPAPKKIEIMGLSTAPPAETVEVLDGYRRSLDKNLPEVV